MERLVVCLLAFIVTVHLLNRVSSNPPCQWNGFEGCECNILGACDVNGKPKAGLDTKTLSGYAPSILQIPTYSTGDGQKQNLAYLCEGNTVAVLYDCNKRIPRYAATVMTGDQLNAKGFDRPDITFRQSNDPSLQKQYQQYHDDYRDSKDREICYNTKAQGLLIDNRWYDNLNPGKAFPSQTKNCKLPSGVNKDVAVHKGHLIAAGYGRGNPFRAVATFVYTNVVPQFGRFNSGQWMRFEKRLVKWGRENCAITNAKNAKMHIIVGAIPSTYPIGGAAYPRYFGSGGFSDYINDSSFWINVPSVMWTAACCTFQLQDGSGNLVDETRHTAFWRDNGPEKEPCGADITKLFGQYANHFFPASQSSCSDSKNYRQI